MSPPLTSMEIDKKDAENQKEDGRWVYRYYPDSGKEKDQIDFHQGFILNSLNEAVCFLNLKDQKYTDAIQKGYDFSFAELDFCDISSTQLRSRIANGEKINDIVTSEVEDYIKENGLYKN